MPIAFLRQTFKSFHTTGAIAPSSPFLARALCRQVPAAVPDGFRALEVGPGTGAVSRVLVRHFAERGLLDLYEINADFCAVLARLQAHDPIFMKVGKRLQLHQGDVRQLHAAGQYDMIISGLPFNNFEGEEVRGFIEHFRALLKPGGTLSWFEYVAIRRLQSPFVGAARRKRLRSVSEVTDSFVRAHQFKQQIIPINLPPARVRHLKFG